MADESSPIAAALVEWYDEVESTLLSLLVNHFAASPCSARPHGLWTITVDQLTEMILECVQDWYDWDVDGRRNARRAAGEIGVGYGDMGLWESSVRSFIVGPVGDMMYAIGAALRGHLDGEVEP